jgi:hypothetical protein
VVWVSGEPRPKTGEVVRVPALQTLNVPVTLRGVVVLGAMTWSAAAVGHDDSEPVGTSE